MARHAEIMGEEPCTNFLPDLVVTQDHETLPPFGEWQEHGRF